MPISKKPRKKVSKAKQKNLADNVIGFVPNSDQIEGFLGSVFPSRSNENPLDKAQNIMYEAWECTDPKNRISLAQEALRASPLCADAYNLLAQEHSKYQEDALEYYRKAVKAGKEALGPEGFAEYAGLFWGFHETRPYMRARAGLGEALWVTGAKEEAISNFKEMLELNPGDNQGIRYILAAKLLEIERLDDLKALLELHEDEHSADIQYTRALVAYSENAIDAQKIAENAWQINKHIPGMLSGRTPLAELNNYITMGGEDEATSYIGAFGQAWKRKQGAIEWLEKVTSLL